MYIESQN